MLEVWKEIEGFNGNYEVSNFGRIRSSKFGKIKILRIGMARSHYPSVALCQNGVPKTYLVHRLVAQAFIPNPENKPQVNHIDGNKYNNCVKNLEWTTARENMNHSRYILGNCGENALKKKIKCVETGQIFESAHEASRVVKIDRANMCKAAKTGKIAGGRHWKWV